jgi:8-oxo-dGTP pyrophosphatase MutT (NUDIX family)
LLVGKIVRAIKRAGLRSAFQVLRVYWFVRRPKAVGVKCAVVDGERVVLVRHTYGDRHVWDMPGGAVKRGETTLDAARREVREEIGVESGDWRELGGIYLIIRGKRNRLYGCAAAVDPGTPVVVDEVEIARGEWFHRDALPDPVTAWVKLFADAAIDRREIARGTEVTPRPRPRRLGMVPRP